MNKKNIEKKLQNKKKNELVEIAKKLELKRYSKLNKQSLIDYLLSIPENRNKIESIIQKSTESKTLKFIKWVKDKIVWISLIAASITIISTVIKFSQNRFEVIEEVEKFDSSDSTYLKIALLPFYEDKDNVDIKIDYRKNIYEYLSDKHELENVKFKAFFTECKLECPKTEKEIIEFGKLTGSDLIIWGSSEENNSNSGIDKVRVRFNLLNNFKNEYLSPQGDTETQPINDLSQLRSGYLQKDVKFIIHWIEGMISFKKNDYSNAIEHFKLVEREFLQDSFNFSILNQLAKLNYHFGNYNTSLAYFDKIYKNDIDSRDSFNIIIGEYFVDKAIILIELGKTEEALSANKNASIIFNNCKYEKISGISRLYNNFGRIYLKRNEVTKAEQNYLKGIRILRTYPDTINKPYSTLLKNLGGIYFPPFQQKYKMGRDYFKRAIKIEEKVLSPNHPSIARSYMNLGTSHIYSNEFDDALKYYFDAEKIILRSLNPTHPDLGTIYNLIGATYGYKDDYFNSLHYLKKSLKVEKRNLKESNKYKYSLSLSNTGVVSYEQNEIDSAIVYLEKALEIQKELLDSSHVYFLITQNFLGYSYNSKQEYQKALKLLERSVNLLDEYGDVKDKIKFFEEISTSCYQLGRIGRSKAFLKKGDELSKRYNIRSVKLRVLDSLINLN